MDCDSERQMKYMIDGMYALLGYDIYYVRFYMRVIQVYSLTFNATVNATLPDPPPAPSLSIWEADKNIWVIRGNWRCNREALGSWDCVLKEVSIPGDEKMNWEGEDWSR